VFRFFAVLSLLVFAGSAALAADDSADRRAAREEEWSVRLMQEQARIDHARKRLDEANAAYARAVAKREDAPVVESFESRRRAAAAELADAEETLPRLVQEAREEGIREEILAPYRFAVAPPGAR
jgi:hypothetical protein